MPHPLETVHQETSRLKHSGYLLQTYDEVISPEVILTLATEEVSEVEDALQRDDLAEASKEVRDVMSFFFSFILQHMPQLHAPDHVYSVNGYGKHSNAWESLHEPLLDSYLDPRSVREFLRRMWSLALHEPFVMTGLLDIEKNTKKVWANYPPELMTLYDPTLGRNSLPEEVPVRYAHMVRALKLIRADITAREGERPLLRSDWELYRVFLEHWELGEWAIGQIQQQLVAEAKDRAEIVQPTAKEVVIFTAR